MVYLPIIGSKYACAVCKAHGVAIPLTGSGIKTIATFKSGLGKCNLERSQENLAQSFKTALSGTVLKILTISPS